ncbi:S-adenosyl-L-methionine-dependent methyltransferase [Rhizopus microsporus var. microsporus]|uniref:S-adenosyl-L-methionine-dependent methyltransferase n=2 Tax=Rhizopus microsporus TaxID=58291 RepID=A0A2G4SYK9_RHIZD|nr:S-adenosyl-L-methionine-dependent methyltransferase [Rhizopus microsporus ATCC 52813]ORE07420.1 S-adenosyl-L-methionine-dependent methyltransferase [Rhizopus microsporus var. microsporus]PHZ13859.1 S-adenosyl-L-methionine-dependent methyltransferase [Rhizopus microsporus ATCC 52813]
MTVADIDTYDWEGHWKEGTTNWDAGKPSPALVELFENEETRSLIPDHGKALVPGCGSGYDVVFLANEKRHVTGIDLSPSCVESLLKNHPDAAKHNYQFLCADFFEFDVPDGGYDLAYDYTFLCALPPVLRPDWAKRYSEIIKKGGVFVTLMYPIDNHEGGPPYAVSEQVYKDLLSAHFDLIFIKDAKGHEPRLGREKIAIWKRK